MTKIERNLRGYVEIEIRSASPSLCLNRLADENIPFWSVSPNGTFSFRIFAFFRDAKKICRVAERTQAEAVVVKEVPGIWFFLTWLRRPCLLLSILTALFAVLVLPNYVWTISVSGNETIPTSEILRALDDMGVHFGAKNDSFQSQDIKNHLLNAVEGLQWAAVNCSGGHCEVLVKERIPAPDILNRHKVTNVVASRDGTIAEMRVLAGQALCQVGDTVTAGQTLVSGVTDWVIDLQTAHAQAEIYALTWRDLEITTPASYTKSLECTEKSVCRYLQLGRFRIKISGSSRICEAGCDKMITREVLTLPGGFTFPVVLITETYEASQTETCTLSREEALSILSGYGTSSVSESMIAGEILSSDTNLSVSGGRYNLEASYACREMIAREQDVNLFGSD